MVKEYERNGKLYRIDENYTVYVWVKRRFARAYWRRCPNASAEKIING